MKKKRLLLINSVCGIRSTGRICAGIANEYEAKGWEVKIAYGRETYVPDNCRKWAVRVGNWMSVRLHALMTRLWGDHSIGFCSWWTTRKFLKWADEYHPDLLWLHNIHGYYLNVPLLFKWIKSRPNMAVKWTLHDCSAFTGRCGYFTVSGCEQWKTECRKCPQPCGYKSYFIFGGPRRMFNINRKSYLGVKNMTLITPSMWLADLTRESFLKCYPVKVIHNTIDTSVFNRRPSNFRQVYGVERKYLVLGVASTWEHRKGLNDFWHLAEIADDDIRIVLVGLSESQIQKCPRNVIGISRTNNAIELAEIYSIVDVFFNPTHEENYPTVNLEAKACGCKIVTYDTGGCAETVDDYPNAIVLKGDDKTPESFLAAIQRWKQSEILNDKS